MGGTTPTVTTNAGVTATIGSVIAGPADLNKAGAGTLTLTGTNTYSGATTIAAGILAVGNGGTAGTLGTGTITNNATLSLNRNDTLTVANAIGGTGTVIQNGNGTTILTGTNTYTGGTTINNGVVQLGDGGTTGSIVGNVNVTTGEELHVQPIRRHHLRRCDQWRRGCPPDRDRHDDLDRDQYLHGRHSDHGGHRCRSATGAPRAASWGTWPRAASWRSIGPTR